jgi:hypothetical protein
VILLRGLIRDQQRRPSRRAVCCIWQFCGPYLLRRYFLVLFPTSRRVSAVRCNERLGCGLGLWTLADDNDGFSDSIMNSLSVGVFEVLQEAEPRLQ